VKYLLRKYEIRLRRMKERILFHILPQGKIFHDPQDHFTSHSDISLAGRRAVPAAKLR